MRFFKADLRRACTEPVFRLCLVLALGCALGPWLAASSRLTKAPIYRPSCSPIS